MLFLAALAGIAFLTRPTTSSLRRLADKSARDEAGGGVAGWISGKIAQGAFALALETGGYKIYNYGVTLVLVPTQQLEGTETAHWIFIGKFGLVGWCSKSFSQVKLVGLLPHFSLHPFRLQ